MKGKCYLPLPLHHYLKEYEEFKDATERRREEAGIGDSHFEEKGMEEAIPNIDERVLVEIADPSVIASRGPAHPIIVQWMMGVVGLIL